MPIRYKTNCSICRLCKGDPILRTRIYNAYFKPDEGDERVSTIARELGKSTASMHNHCHKHISMPPVKTPVIVAHHIESMKAEIAKEIEQSFDHDSMIPKQDFERVIDDVLAEGLAQLKAQGKNITISQLITAAKIKADYSSKRRGQDTELIKTLYRAASGYSTNISSTRSETESEPV